MPSQSDCPHGSRKLLRIPVVSRSVSSPSLRRFQSSSHTVLHRQNSSLLTAVFATMQKWSRFSSAQLHRFCSCMSQAVLPSRCLCTRSNCGKVLPFKYRVMCFMFISSLSVEKKIFCAESSTLYMMSARSWHVYNSFPTVVLHTVRFSVSSSTSDYVQFVMSETTRICQEWA